MDFMSELAAIAKEHGSIIETKIAAQHGISKAMLYKLCKEDKIHRIVKGQYVLLNDMQYELLSISKRSEKIVFSHETALYLHGVSDRTPFEHSILHRLDAFLLQRSSPSVKYITSNPNCSISVGLH